MKLVQRKVKVKGKWRKPNYNMRDLRSLFLAASRYYDVEIDTVTVDLSPDQTWGIVAGTWRSGTGRSMRIELADAEVRYIKNLTVIDKLAAQADNGWLSVPQDEFDKLCLMISGLVADMTSADWVEESHRLRFKVPKAKVKPTGAAYHQVEINKIEKQIETWRANQKKAEQNLARIKRGIKAREKKIKYHTKQRDKKAEAEA